MCKYLKIMRFIFLLQSRNVWKRLIINNKMPKLVNQHQSFLTLFLVIMYQNEQMIKLSIPRLPMGTHQNDTMCKTTRTSSWKRTKTKTKEKTKNKLLRRKSNSFKSTSSNYQENNHTNNSNNIRKQKHEQPWKQKDPTLSNWIDYPGSGN